MSDEPNTVKEIEEERDMAYSERNQFVLQKLEQYEKLGITVGWKINDEDPESDWIVIYVLEQDHEFFGHIGQMGWHVNRNKVDPETMDWLEPVNQEYDGHSDKEKYDRLLELDRKIINRTYTVTETHLVQMVSKMASARGELEGLARSQDKFEENNEEGLINGLMEKAQSLGSVTEGLLELHRKQYRRRDK